MSLLCSYSFSKWDNQIIFETSALDSVIGKYACIRDRTLTSNLNSKYQIIIRYLKISNLPKFNFSISDENLRFLTLKLILKFYLKYKQLYPKVHVFWFINYWITLIFLRDKNCNQSFNLMLYFFCKWQIFIEIKLFFIDINRSLEMRPILPQNFFEKYRNIGNISNFKIYIIWISVYSKTDFFF